MVSIHPPQVSLTLLTDMGTGAKMKTCKILMFTHSVIMEPRTRIWSSVTESELLFFHFHHYTIWTFTEPKKLFSG